MLKDPTQLTNLLIDKNDTHTPESAEKKKLTLLQGKL
jgi:hypothetical protein